MDAGGARRADGRAVVRPGGPVRRDERRRPDARLPLDQAALGRRSARCTSSASTRQRRGCGLGRTLVDLGLRHLRASGLDDVLLYVEADNTRAVSLYDGLGFTHAAADTHVMYARPVQPT